MIKKNNQSPYNIKKWTSLFFFKDPVAVQIKIGLKLANFIKLMGYASRKLDITASMNSKFPEKNSYQTC